MNPYHGPVAATRVEVRIDDLVLPGRVWPAERPRARVAIVHGMGEHSGRYAALAGELATRGFTVASLDLPGNGEAPGRRGDVPSWPRLRDSVVGAISTLPDRVPGQPAGLPAVWFGHSFGGLLALDYALAHGSAMRGVVACAPAVRTARPPAVKLALARIVNRVAPSVGFPNGLDVAALSRDPEVLALRARDPLAHDRVSPRTYFAMLEAQARVLSRAPTLSVPALLLQGECDRWVDPRGTLELEAAAPRDRVTYVLYRNASHEVFNDPAREQAIPDLLGWLERIVTA